MLTIEHTVHVKAPLEVVWAHLAELEQAPDWVTLLESVRVEGEGPPGEGTQFRERSRVAGFPFETTWTITAWEAPRRQAYAGATPAMDARIALRLTPTDTGTRIRHRFTGTMLPGVPAVGRVLEWLFGGLVRRGLRKSLQHLRVLVERRDGRGGTTETPRVRCTVVPL
jgi:uncharacterized membrane protein